MYRVTEAVLSATACMSWEPSVRKATGLEGAGFDNGAATTLHLMYPQFGDDLTMLHLSEPVPTVADGGPSEAKPKSYHEGYTICSPLVESVPTSARATIKGAADRLLPSYDSIASLAAEGKSVSPCPPATSVVSGHKRFYAAHFTSYYGYALVTCSLAAVTDIALWTSLYAMFALIAFGGLLSTCLLLWITTLASVAPLPVVNAPQPLSPIPPKDDLLASYLYQMLSVGSFGSSAYRPTANYSTMPHHFAMVFQFVTDNVRPTESLLSVLLIVFGLIMVSACLNLGCCYCLSLAPNALHKQWQGNGNNSISSVIALGAHQVTRRFHQHSAAIRSRGVRMARHSLLAMVVLKLTINLFLELDRQGVFPNSKGIGVFGKGLAGPMPSTPQNSFPMESVTSTVAALNKIVGFITTVSLTFVSADLIAGRLVNVILVDRAPFFVAADQHGEEVSEESQEIFLKESVSTFPNHAAICPQLPDRLRYKTPKDEESGAVSQLDPNAGRRGYYQCGPDSRWAARPSSSTLNWMTELSPYVLSTEVVALAECFRKLLFVTVASLSMLLFWRWPTTLPLIDSIYGLRSSVGSIYGPAYWMVALLTGHSNMIKGTAPPEQPSILTFSSICVGLLFGLSLSLLLYARRATAISQRVAAKRSQWTFQPKNVKAPTLSAVLTQPASGSTFADYVSIWSRAQSLPFLKTLDHNSTSPSPQAEASASARPTLAIAPAYKRDRQGLYVTSLVPTRLPHLPFKFLMLAWASFVIARNLLIFPVVGMVTAATMPKINAPRLSQPDTSLFQMLQEANPILVAGLAIVCIHVWLIVFTMLRDSCSACSDLWESGTLSLLVTSRLSMLAGATNTPFFRPLRHGYCDGVYDLCHAGHKRVIERASGCCDRLFVGSMCDEDCIGYKRRPTMSTAERAEEVARCQGVFRCIPASPPKGIPIPMLAYYGITQVIYGEEYHKDGDIYYVAARELGIGITAPRTDALSTSELLRRAKQ